MSTTDKVFRAIGISLAGSAASWLATLGVMLIVETARHQPAHVGATSHTFFWPVFAILGSAVSVVYGVISSAVKE